MKSLNVRCFSDEGNNAVLQLPGRKFPGILIQGDSFKNLLEMARTVKQLSASGGDALTDEVDALVEYLESTYSWFERAVLESDGISPDPAGEY